MTTLLEGLFGDPQQQTRCRTASYAPNVDGRSQIAFRISHAPAANWASWADCFPMIQERLPGITHFIEQLESEEAVGCLGSFVTLRGGLDRSRPTWESLRAGSRPPPDTTAELGEWQHGRQFYASSSLEHHFPEALVFAQSFAANQAHLRSHSGPGASAVLCKLPRTRVCVGARRVQNDCGCLCKSRSPIAARIWTSWDGEAEGHEHHSVGSRRTQNRSLGIWIAS